MSDLTFYYFDIRGRGEPSRLVLAAAGKKYDDVRVSDWPASKDKTPYGSLPYLEYKGQTYGQSQAIAFFLAREFGLAGKTNADGLRVQEISALVEDFMQLIVKANFEPDEAKKAEYTKKLEEEDTPKFLGFWEKHLVNNGGSGYFVGNSVTLADLAVFDITDSLVMKAGEGLMGSFPNIKKMRDNVKKHPNVGAYLSKRKESPF